MNLRNRTIYIGDNLPRLRGIDSESVDLIYLDPPFNARTATHASLPSRRRCV